LTAANVSAHAVIVGTVFVRAGRAATALVVVALGGANKSRLLQRRHECADICGYAVLGHVSIVG
jgi:hypothetical protein